jgi:hypothetical protein
MPVDKDFEEAARRWFAVQESADYERRMAQFRAGRLGAVEAEQIAADLCATGDRVKREAAEREEKASRQRGAKLRAGITK